MKLSHGADMDGYGNSVLTVRIRMFGYIWLTPRDYELRQSDIENKQKHCTTSLQTSKAERVCQA